MSSADARSFVAMVDVMILNRYRLYPDCVVKYSPVVVMRCVPMMAVPA
jgi:hypothetical protein